MRMKLHTDYKSAASQTSPLGLLYREAGRELTLPVVSGQSRFLIYFTCKDVTACVRFPCEKKYITVCFKMLCLAAK